MRRSASSNRPAEVVGDPARRVRRVRAALERDHLEVGVAAPGRAGRAHPRRVASDDRQPPCHRCADATRCGHSPSCPPRPALMRGVHAPTVSERAKLGQHPRYGRCRLTSLADTPWMTEAVDALARELRLHHAPTADHSHRLATLARHVAERLAPRAARRDRGRARRGAPRRRQAHDRPAPARLGGPARRGDQRARIRRHTIAGRGAPRRDRRARAPREPRPRDPRGVGRDRLPGRPARRADPADGAHRLRRRLVRRDDERSRLPHRAAAARGVPAAAHAARAGSSTRRWSTPCCASSAAGRSGARRLDMCPSCPRSRSPRAACDAALRGATIESALAPGINALKTFDPPLHALEGADDRAACGAAASTSSSTSTATSRCSST